jgi:predicted nucleic acid-binding protein
MPLLVDAGVLYALIDRTDAWHARTVKYLKTAETNLLAPVTVLPEAAYLIRTRLGTREELKLIESFAKREVGVEPLTDADLDRAFTVMSRYPLLGFTDSTIVAMAERLALTTIATTDRRHFTVVRPRHVRQFTLVP